MLVLIEFSFGPLDRSEIKVRLITADLQAVPVLLNSLAYFLYAQIDRQS